MEASASENGVITYLRCNLRLCKHQRSPWHESITSKAAEIHPDVYILFKKDEKDLKNNTIFRFYSLIYFEMHYIVDKPIDINRTVRDPFRSHVN